MKFSPTTIKLILLRILAIGVPGIYARDAAGITGDSISLINFESVLRGGIYMLALAYISLELLLSPNSLKLRQILFCPFMLLLIYFAVGLILYHSLSQALIPMYRLFEWIVVVFLLNCLYKNRSESFSPYFLFSARWIVLFPIIFVLIGCLISPSLAFSNTIDGFIRLGGYIYGPNTLGVLAAIGFAYTIFYKKSIARILYLLFYLIIVLLTYSRGAMIGLILSFFMHQIFISKNKYFLFSAIPVAALFFGNLTSIFIGIFARGQSFETLLTGSERTTAWIASILTFQSSPLIGYGYIIGPKKVGEYFNYLGTYHWKTTSAHNDLLQSLVSGGFIAGLLLFIFYILLAVRLYKFVSCNNISYQLRSFFLMTTTQLFVFSSLTPMMAGIASSLSIMTLWIFIEIGYYLNNYKSTPQIT